MVSTEYRLQTQWPMMSLHHDNDRRMKALDEVVNDEHIQARRYRNPKIQKAHIHKSQDERYLPGKLVQALKETQS